MGRQSYTIHLELHVNLNCREVANMGPKLIIYCETKLADLHHKTCKLYFSCYRYLSARVYLAGVLVSYTSQP